MRTLVAELMELDTERVRRANERIELKQVTTPLRSPFPRRGYKLKPPRRKVNWRDAEDYFRRHRDGTLQVPIPRLRFMENPA